MARGRNAYLDHLAKVPLFSSLPKKDLQRLARVATEIPVPAKRQLVEQDKTGREAFVIVEGQAEVAVHGTVVNRLGPGEVIGEMALLDHSPRSATVTASTPMRVLVLDPVGFRSILRTPTVATGMATGLAKRLRDLEGGPTYESGNGNGHAAGAKEG